MTIDAGQKELGDIARYNGCMSKGHQARFGSRYFSGRPPVFFALVLIGVWPLAAHSHECSLKQETSVFSSPTIEQPSLGTLPKGKRVFCLELDGAFRQLRSRSGRSLWVEEASIGPAPETYSLAGDVEGEFPARPTDFKRIRLDVGVSGGSAKGESVLEGAVGVQYFMMERLSLRHAIFYRHSPTQTDFMGLDLSVRGNGNLPLGALKLRGIVGGGYRFATADGASSPFGEIGGFAALRGFDIGIMAKLLILPARAKNEIIYSVVFSGNAGFL